MKGKYKHKKQAHEARHEAHAPGMDSGKIQEHAGEKDGDEKTDRREAHMKESTRWWREPSHIIQSVGIIVGLAVAVIYFCQLRTMQHQYDLSRKAMEIDQRPYLWDSNVMPEATIKPGQKLWANIHLVNFGKSPALRVRGVEWIFLGADAKQRADEWFAAWDDKELPENKDETGIVVPPGIPNATIEQLKNGAGFGGGGFLTAMNDRVLQQSDVDYIMHTEEAFVIVLHLQYFDGFGNRYWTNICLSEAEGRVEGPRVRVLLHIVLGRFRQDLPAHNSKFTIRNSQFLLHCAHWGSALIPPRLRRSSRHFIPLLTSSVGRGAVSS